MAILKVDTISGIGTEGPVFEGDIEFTSQNFLTLPKGDTTQRGRGTALFGGGSTSTDVIQKILIQSTGNAEDFGDLSGNRYENESVASSTRGVFAGGSQPTTVNTIEFITIATTGNATDFGDRTEVKNGLGGFSDVHGGIGD